MEADWLLVQQPLRDDIIEVTPVEGQRVDRTDRRGRRILMCIRKSTLSIAIAFVIGPALANGGVPDASSAGADEDRGQRSTETVDLDAVMVHARKREESIINVPVVMNVLTQENLERTKTENLYAVAKQVPGLLLGNAVNSAGTQVSLRGVGTTALNTIMDQSVSLSVDGLPLSQGAAYGAAMFDVGQIEVLKGPQALFYGKNSPAGVISLRSVDPTGTTEFIARLGYEYEAEEKVLDLIASGSVSDSLKLRLAVRHSDQEGFFENRSEATPGLGGLTPPFHNYAPTRNTIVRGTALFEPGERYSARLKVTYNDYRMNGGASPLHVTYCPDGTGGVPPLDIPFISGVACSLTRYVWLAWPDPAYFPGGLPNGGRPFEDNRQVLASLEQNIALSGNLSLTSVTGYYNQDYETLHSGSATNITVPFMNHITFTNEQFTQELRLSSNFDGQVNFMVGAFYQSGDLSNEVRLPTNSAMGLPPILQHVWHGVDVRSTSAFGQVRWDITPKVEVAAGARWTNEVREHVEVNHNLVQGPLGPVERPDPRLDSSNVSPELSVAYKPSENLTLFSSYKTGYKSGSFGVANYVPPSQLASFKDERVRGGEAGLKFRSADRNFMANFATYLYKYRDLQVGAMELYQLPDGGYIFASRTINAASATVKGFDLDFNYLPPSVDGLTMTAAINYNRARYDSFTNAPCGNGQTIAEGCDQLFNPATGRYMAQDLSGRRLVRAPEWTLYGGFNRELYLSNGMGLGFGGGARYVSEYATTLVDLPGFEQGGFVKYDANIALRAPNDRWEVALIGSNLGNKLTRGWCVNSNVQNGTVFGGQVAGDVEPGPAGSDEAACFIERGREIWARLTWRF